MIASDYYSLIFCCCNILLITCPFAVTQAQRDIIFELRRIAFDGENDPTGTEKRKAMYTKDYKMLGFTVSLQSTYGSLLNGGTLVKLTL